MTRLMQQLSEPVLIRPMRSEVDYEAVLNEIDLLFDAQPDTPVFGFIPSETYYLFGL